jgi:hypothetical protein
MDALQCLHPLVVADEFSSAPIPNTNCALPCPLPFYTEGEWRAICELRFALGVFSFVGSVLLSFSLVLFTKHLHHQVINAGKANVLVYDI